MQKDKTKKKPKAPDDNVMCCRENVWEQGADMSSDDIEACWLVVGCTSVQRGTDVIRGGGVTVLVQLQRVELPCRETTDQSVTMLAPMIARARGCPHGRTQECGDCSNPVFGSLLVSLVVRLEFKPEGGCL
jgi:hypothetical protein